MKQESDEDPPKSFGGNFLEHVTLKDLIAYTMLIITLLSYYFTTKEQLAVLSTEISHMRREIDSIERTLNSIWYKFLEKDVNPDIH